MQKLQNHHGSGLATIPKRFLERDDLVDDDGEPKDDVSLTVDRLDEKVYAIRVCDGEVPEVEDTDFVQRLLARHVLDQDSPTPRAD